METRHVEAFGGSMFPLYQSHKFVRAALILSLEPEPPSTGKVVEYRCELGWFDRPSGTKVTQRIRLAAETIARLKSTAGAAELRTLIGGYLVVYKDGFISWSPADVFEEGYSAR